MAAALGEVLFEFHRVGRSVKVSALHVATGVEVCLVAPAGGAVHALRDAALRKLAYVLGRSRPSAEPEGPIRDRRGV